MSVEICAAIPQANYQGNYPTNDQPDSPTASPAQEPANSQKAATRFVLMTEAGRRPLLQLPPEQLKVARYDFLKPPLFLERLEAGIDPVQMRGAAPVAF